MPAVISYQGLLTDPDTNEPVPDGMYGMHFGIYNAAVAGAQLWEESVAPTVIPVPVAGGVFTVLLGGIIPLSPAVFAGGDACLEVEVDGETLAPRRQIAAVAYAMVAQTLDGESLTGLDDRYVNVTGDTMTGALNVLSGGDGFRVGNPNSWLEVSTGGNTRLSLGDGNGNEAGFISGGENTLTIAGCSDPGGCPAFTTFNQSGNVGIGTTDPSARLDVRGDVSYTGALIGAFPRPAYDSGFVAIAQGALESFAHNLGGDPEDYVVDLQCKDTGGFLPNGITNLRVGLEDLDGGDDAGAYWFWLFADSISVLRGAQDVTCDQVRVRIWETK